MMEAVRTSETSVYIHETTQRYIPEGRRENFKSRTEQRSDSCTDARASDYIGLFYIRHLLLLHKL
jgi:hypothetical protein